MKQSEFNLILRELNMAAELLITCVEKLSKLEFKERGGVLENIPPKEPMVNVTRSVTSSLESLISKVKSPENYAARPNQIGGTENTKFKKNKSFENFHKAWTPESDIELEDLMRETNFDWDYASKHFKRSEQAIRARMTIIRKNNAKLRQSLTVAS